MRESPVCRRFAGYGIRQKTKRDCGAHDDCGCGNPDGGFSVAQYGFYPLLYADLPESGRTGKDRPSRSAAVRKSGGVGFLLAHTHVFDDFFIAGNLYIPAEEDVGRPHQRMEPVYGEQQVAKEFPPVVPARKMRLLVGEDIGNLFFGRSRRQIDPGSYDSQDKRGADRVAEPDIALKGDSLPDPAQKQQKINQSKDEQDAESGRPQNRREECQDIQRVDAGAEGGREWRASPRTERCKDSASPRLESGLEGFPGKTGTRDGLPLWPRAYREAVWEPSEEARGAL